MTDTYPILALTRVAAAYAVDMPWRDTLFTSLSDATDFLDCLENYGIEQHECLIEGDQFHVRWR